jgi:hypothetical protein
MNEYWVLNGWNRNIGRQKTFPSPVSSTVNFTWTDLGLSRDSTVRGQADDWQPKPTVLKPWTTRHGQGARDITFFFPLKVRTKVRRTEPYGTKCACLANRAQCFSTRGPRVVPNNPPVLAGCIQQSTQFQSNLDWTAVGNSAHNRHSASAYCQPYLPWISVTSGFQSCNLHSASRTSHRHGLHGERDQSNVTGPAANNREHTDSVKVLLNGSVVQVTSVKNETIKALQRYVWLICCTELSLLYNIASHAPHTFLP